MTNLTLTRGPANATLNEAAAKAVQDSGILSNSYFERLDRGDMSKDAFIKSQKQFYFAVAFYARPMALLLSRSGDALTRLELLHNIVDEHGGLNLARSHENTFKRFLASLSSACVGDDARNNNQDRVLMDKEASPAVLAFNRTLTATCSFEPLEEGIACLAVIELAFATISTMIGDAVIKRGFVDEEHLVHYSVHKHLDKKHADDFFALIEKDWRDQKKRANIERGLFLGLHIFDRLYDELAKIGDKN